MTAEAFIEAQPEPAASNQEQYETSDEEFAVNEFAVEELTTEELVVEEFTARKSPLRLKSSLRNQWSSPI